MVQTIPKAGGVNDDLRDVLETPPGLIDPGKLGGDCLFIPGHMEDCLWGFEKTCCGRGIELAYTGQVKRIVFFPFNNYSSCYVSEERSPPPV